MLACSSAKKIIQPTASISTVKFIGQYTIPFDMSFKGTTVGGLSGIDYDKTKDIYYMICDDRSDRNPARFYTAKIEISEKGIDSFELIDTKPLLTPEGNSYPNNKVDPFHTPDPEAMRYNPNRNQLVWSSEGERALRAKDTILVNPGVYFIGIDGSFSDSLSLPENLRMSVGEKGPRQNGVLEGMSFADDYRTLFVSVEEPLYEDGPRADVSDNNAYTRIFKFDVAKHDRLAQYAYKLDPVAKAPSQPNGFKVNGVVDVLYAGDNKLLVMERSFSTGTITCTIKVFLSDLSGATDVSGIALKDNKAFTPASKKLILNMDDLHMFIDNIEGMTFGPALPNGHKTLLFIADNNFSFTEKAQVLLFEIIE